MKKKIAYTNLLKEALFENTFQKGAMDVKGPMLDPILGYDGGGELPTHKDAASILERYYFNENDNRVSVKEHEDNDIDEVPPKEDNKLKSIKKQIEKEITTESDNKDFDTIEVNEDCGCNSVNEDTVEESVIQKLISEMESDDNEDEDEDEEIMEESNRVVGDTGAGTQAAGTGDDDDTLLDRKDSTNEDLSMFLEMDEEDNEEDKNLDVDKATNEGLEQPSKNEEEELEEAFSIFKEEIEKDEVDEIDTDEITV